MRRILWHIPEKGQQRIRYYGLYHSHKKALRQRYLEQLGQYPEAEVQLLSWEQFLEQLGVKQPRNCPVCGAPLVIASLSVTPYQQSLPQPRDRGNLLH